MTIALLVVLAGIAADNAAALELRRDGAAVAALKADEVQSMAAVNLEWKHHDQLKAVRGVALLDLLKRAGWSAGPSGKEVKPSEKHSGSRFVAVVTAADGYQAVFSVAELVDGKTNAVLAWFIDGKPLPADVGPFRMVVPTDEGMARSTYQVRRIDLVDMRRIVR